MSVHQRDAPPLATLWAEGPGRRSALLSPDELGACETDVLVHQHSSQLHQLGRWVVEHIEDLGALADRQRDVVLFGASATSSVPAAPK
jgi:hypothetical protein